MQGSSVTSLVDLESPMLFSFIVFLGVFATLREIHSRERRSRVSCKRAAIAFGNLKLETGGPAEPAPEIIISFLCALCATAVKNR